MIKELMHDPIFLGLKSETATEEDLQVAQDLLETLVAHKEICVGRRLVVIASVPVEDADVLTTLYRALM